MFKYEFHLFAQIRIKKLWWPINLIQITVFFTMYSDSVVIRYNISKLQGLPNIMTVSVVTK